ncbi:MAG: RNA methyltransferase [Clostridia bacterium]|nr:RNA methyltransferase [Clostridia bacterium]
MLNFKEITAKDNNLLKLTTLLQKSAKARKDKGLFVLEGLRICRDAAENGVAFETLILSKSVYSAASARVKDLYVNAKNGVVIGDELFKRISDTTSPQGIIALCYVPEAKNEINPCGRYVALENISDPANIGAVARTAEALGVDGMIISGDSCDVYSPKALRASMGTLVRLPLHFCDDIIDFLSKHSLRGFACVAEEVADCKFGDCSFTDGDVVIIGNEANGLMQSTKDEAFKTINISMRGNAESLNAAAAAAIAMWELMK